MSDKFDEDDPAVIRAKAEAEAQVLEARAKLHPASQFVHTTIEEVSNFMQNLGCLIIVAIIVIAAFAPQLFNLILHR